MQRCMLALVYTYLAAAWVLALGLAAIAVLVLGILLGAARPPAH
jgi:hypothetical protein